MNINLILIYLIIGVSLTIWSRKRKTVHLMDFFYILLWPLWLVVGLIVLLLAILNVILESCDL